jgi:small subunit ribosomal protein S9
MSDTKYSYAIGRRKTAVAQVRLFKGKGESHINEKTADAYITRSDLFHVIYAPLKVA